MKIRRRHLAAFTLIELLIATAVGSVVGSVAYLLATDGLISFARNASLNRGYSDARTAIDQITNAVQSAGCAPTLLDANGVPLTVPLGTSPSAEGVRFYRLGSTPTYYIPSGSTKDSSLTINYSAAQAVGLRGGSPINVGDLVTIPLLGFQGTVASVANTTGANGGSLSLSFYNLPTTPTTTNPPPLGNGCNPAFTSANARTFTYNSANASTTLPTYYTCLVYQQVEFIAVPNAATGTGAQLRYYPYAYSNKTPANGGTACGALAKYNDPVAFANPNNYSVVTNLAATITDAALSTPYKPFSRPFKNADGSAAPTLKIVLPAEGPDYNNRGVALVNTISAATTYSFMQSSMGPRNPILLSSMNVPF